MEVDVEEASPADRQRDEDGEAMDLESIQEPDNTAPCPNVRLETDYHGGTKLKY